MSRKVEKYFPCILKKVKEEFETEINNSGIPSEYKGYISTFGAMVIQNGLIPALAYFEKTDTNEKGNRKKIVSVIKSFFYGKIFSIEDIDKFLKNKKFFSLKEIKNYLKKQKIFSEKELDDFFKEKKHEDKKHEDKKYIENTDMENFLEKIDMNKKNEIFEKIKIIEFKLSQYLAEKVQAEEMKKDELRIIENKVIDVSIGIRLALRTFLEEK
jgi:CRISPR-associated protein, cmr5 family